MGGRIRDERYERERVVLFGDALAPEIAPGRLYIGIDGVHVPMCDGSYHEAKAGIVYQTHQQEDKTKISNAAYMATLERTEAFGDHVYALAFDCGVQRADDIACLGDGATLRRSFDTASGLSAIHVMNAWSTENDLCLGQMKVDGKSNEITAMPALMKLMDIRGSVVTADALNCQKSIAEQIIKQGGDYVLALKNNHPSLYEDVRLFFEDALVDGFDVAYGFCEAEEWGHGRAEVRKCWAVSVDHLEWFKHTSDWKGLTSVVCVQSTRRTKDNESVENRYFISSLEAVKPIAKSIRHHWNVENKLHWVMDVNFDEDACRARTDNAAENFALLRQIAHNLLKQETSKGISIRRKIKKAGWDEDFLVRILLGV